MTDVRQDGDENPENLQDLTDLHPETDVMLQDVLTGLAEAQKRIPSLYFYDQRGSELFDEVCELPEYYPTRTEIAIMGEHAADMARVMGPGVRLVELGSGSSQKVGHLLREMKELACYVPVEISREHLQAAAERLAEEFPEVEILPVCADFTEPFELPVPERRSVQRNVCYFPGSTIGNFPRSMAEDLMRWMSELMGPGGGMLVGVDLRKDKDIIERAYNDAAGVTAAFNLNLLTRLNRELGADFDVEAFAHKAHYDEAEGRIEMHLYSTRAQTVTIKGQRFDLAEGESIHTEFSHKHSLESFAALAHANGFEVQQVWTDPEDLFSVQFLTVA